MKYIKTALLLSLFFILIGGNMGVIALAMDTGFTTETVLDKDAERIIENIDVKLLKEEPKGMSIKCFDVNEKGNFAIGSEKFGYKRIAVYNSDSVFIYGIEFDDNGTFYLELTDDNHLLIYFVRGDIAVSIDSTGKVVEVLQISDTSDNSVYWRSLRSLKRESGEMQYILKNDMGILNIFATSYSQIVAVDVEGNKTVIFDSETTADQVAVIVVVFIGITIFFIVFTIYIVRLIKKQRKQSAMA